MTFFVICDHSPISDITRMITKRTWNLNKQYTYYIKKDKSNPQLFKNSDHITIDKSKLTNRFTNT